MIEEIHVNEVEDKKENQSQNKVTEPIPDIENKQTDKSCKMSMTPSDSNLKRFKTLEKSSHKNSNVSGKISISKLSKSNTKLSVKKSSFSNNNSLSINRTSKASKNIIEDNYKPQDDILNEFEISKTSLKRETSILNISAKGQSRVESSKSKNIEVEDNDNQSKNDRFVATKEQQKYEEEFE